MRCLIECPGHPELTIDLREGPWIDHAFTADEAICLGTDGIEGWDDSPGVKTEFTTNPAGDGAFMPTMLLLDSRVLTIHGVHHVRDLQTGSVTQRMFRDQVASLVGRAVTITVTDSTGPRAVTGMVSAQVPITRASQHTYEFSIIVTCPDPNKYSPPITFTTTDGQIKLENPGNTDTWATIHATGHITWLLAIHNGRRVSWTGDTNALTIDMSTMVPNTGTMSVDDAFRIEPGSSTVQIDATKGATITMTIRPAWR